MNDIFLEIEEDLRRERAAQAWKKFGPYVVTIAVLVVLAVAGWRGYAAYEQSRAAKSGDAYIAAIELARAGKLAEADAALATLQRDGAGGYPVMARFRLAGGKAVAGDAAGAAAAFDALANDSSVAAPLQDVARLRAAMAGLNTASLPEIATRVERLTAETSPYRHLARELLGLAAYRNGDLKAAAKWFDAVYGDVQTPADVRSRAQLVLTLLASDGITPGEGQ